MNMKKNKNLPSRVSFISVVSTKFFKSKKIKSFFKVLLLASYCVLVCSAILFSFKSVFNSITGINNNDNMELVDSGSEFASVLSKIGSRGEDVTKIQRALKNLGYYIGGVDGIFGVKTQDAVMRFQRARGITADGIVSSSTLKALGLQVDTLSANNENDINLLAKLISAESRGESYAGQVAIGAVILNRVNHPSFPDSISAVIYQPGSFSCIDNGQFDQPAAESCYRAARDALNNVDPVGGAIYYYNPKTETNQWIRSRPIIATIGKYVFCS